MNEFQNLFQHTLEKHFLMQVELSDYNLFSRILLNIPILGFYAIWIKISNKYAVPISLKKNVLQMKIVISHLW